MIDQMRSGRRCLCFLTLAAVLAAPSSAWAITFGQIDQFSAVDNAGWIGGAMSGVQADGGPNGTGDAYLRMVADGSGPNGKMTMHNGSPRWLGDYITAGVTRLDVDLKNFTTQPLTVRIAVKQFSGQGSPGYVTGTSKSFLLQPDGLWHRAQFLLSEPDMIPLNGPFGPLSELLAGGVNNAFQELRILHSTTPTLQGANIVGAMGIDNITAIPTPGAAGLLAIGLGVLATRRFRRVEGVRA